MNEPATMYTGPLGSTIHVPSGRRGYRRRPRRPRLEPLLPPVCLDPVRGVITLMSPSHPHEYLTGMLDHVVDAAASTLAGAVRGSATPAFAARVSRPAREWSPTARSTSAAGPAIFGPRSSKERASAVAFIETNRARPGGRGRDHRGRRGQDRTLRQPRGAGAVAGARPQGFVGATGGIPRPWPGVSPRALDASEVLAGLTPGDVCEAVGEVRFSLTLAERTGAVARIVRRRQRASVRVREEEAPYSARLGESEDRPPPVAEPSPSA